MDFKLPRCKLLRHRQACQYQMDSQSIKMPAINSVFRKCENSRETSLTTLINTKYTQLGRFIPSPSPARPLTPALLA